MTEVELVRLQPNNKSLQNLKQYRTGAAKRGFNPGPSYTGGFPVNVQEIIAEIITSPCLHLYSGRSDIGDIRVDLECQEATHRISVEEFITTDPVVYLPVGFTSWEWIILDPPYEIKQKHRIREYAGRDSLKGNTLLRAALSKYFRRNANNILWLDYCCPSIRGFTRSKIWLLTPINCWEHVRVMTWLTRSGPEMRLD